MIRAIVVDDEQPSADKMEKLLNESGMVEVVGKFTEPLKALDFLASNKIGAVFLDIEMPDMDGIELSNRIIDLQGRIAVIFVTAYNQYAVEAFRINALDFLMKPVTAERLRETLHRIIEEKGITIDAARLKVECFGRFRVTSRNGDVKFRTEKAGELLAFLIDRRGNFVSRNEIIDNLWEEYEGDRALIHFNTTLHYLKKALIQNGIQIPIEHERGCYKFDIDSLMCDYLIFCTFVAKASEVNCDNISEFERVAGLYAGDYLEGSEYPWAERSSQMLKDQYLRLLIGISEYYKAAGNHRKYLEWLKTGLMHEPLHRQINYRLVEALLLSNDRLSACRYFDIYRHGLRKKFKQEPDEDFRKLLRY